MTRELLNVAAREEKNTIIIAKRKVVDAQQRTQSKTCGAHIVMTKTSQSSSSRVEETCRVH